MHISRSILDNIGKDIINTYLRAKKISMTNRVGVLSIEELLSELVETDEIHEEDVKEFFFRELMYGKRRYIRLYKLQNCDFISYQDDWLSNLKKRYDIPSLNFNNIMTTFVNKKESQKIAAIRTEINDKGEIDNIKIIFVCYIEMKNDDSSCTYIPVEFDLIKKMIIVKCWRRQDVKDDDNYKPTVIIGRIIQWLEKNLQYTKKEIADKYKEILYTMTKGLVSELFRKIPTYAEARNFKDKVDDFSNNILQKMNLENKRKDENGTFSLPVGIMDIKDELVKLLQRLAVSDYFFNRDYEEVRNMGISAIINSVKFNDKEDILTIVSGAEKRKPVFCSKSFLVLLKSIDEAKEVKTIWISFKYNKKTIIVKYDASKDKYYIEIGMLSNLKDFSEKEFRYILEVIERYESGNYIEIKNMDRTIIG